MSQLVTRQRCAARSGRSGPAVATRRAQVEDEEAYARKIYAERQAHAFCARKITERGLKMKLGKIDQQLDGKRMIIFFTSENRVDFRGLVRDLAA